MSAMFKAILWKELREGLKWALVVLIGMAAVLTYATPSLIDGQSVDLNRISTALDAVTTIGGVLAGLLIGLAQAVVENRGDKWGFLAHRPINRTVMFWSKATAGMLLYAIATGLPVAAMLFRIASPDYLPVPFDWRIALPAVANLFCGLVFYFAGLLTGMRDARWYVSRALGIGTAFGCLVLQGEITQTFWQAIAASVTGVVIVGTAAWSTFIAGGQYGTQPRLGRLATGISIGLGLALVGWLVFAVGLMRFGTPQGSVAFPVSNYMVTANGVVVKITTDANWIVSVSDLDGRQVEQYRNSTDRTPTPGALGTTLSLQRQPDSRFRSIGGLFRPVRRANAIDPVSWHYVHRLGLLAAYDTRSRKMIGWMGPDGFSPGKAMPRAFAGRLRNDPSGYDAPQPLLAFDDAVYWVDLDERRIEKVFQREPAEVLLSAGAVRSGRLDATTEERAGWDVISTTRRVLVQRRDGTRILEVPQDPNAVSYALLHVYRAARAPGAPTFLWYSPSGQPNRGSYISQFTDAGTKVKSWNIPATDIPQANSSLRGAVISAITPPIAQVVLEFAKPQSMQRALSSGIRQAPRWAMAVLFSLLSAAAVFLRGRTRAFSAGQLGTWTGIALLLGPLGYLMMLTLIEWPARESCPACSRKRVVTREHCEHCGAPFAAPQQDGTEIFEPAG